MVPKLLTYGGWGFCHIILLELVEASSLSQFTRMLIYIGNDAVDGQCYHSN